MGCGQRPERPEEGSRRREKKAAMRSGWEELSREGGRLDLSELPDSQKHPLLLPKTRHFTDLVIDYFHKKLLHSGVKTTLSPIRTLHCVPSGQTRVRRVIKGCMTCFRVKNQTTHQMMSDLPRDRIVPSRPFDNVGIDFAGPIITKPNLKRSKATIKIYCLLSHTLTFDFAPKPLISK
ncbi:hypothetical protein AVEN_253516-1 [Araneus ventricosus]|uniref:Integrase zinc-binding domain-containing protein n=1 Tax=Araneus ventricosus TaxID=182803 RepID=A0A4Y2BTB5_ARAVE|nr:hypothetical protein AVEN_253516-1 [Araneus ventricosus]